MPSRRDEKKPSIIVGANGRHAIAAHAGTPISRASRREYIPTRSLRMYTYMYMYTYISRTRALQHAAQVQNSLSRGLFTLHEAPSSSPLSAFLPLSCLFPLPRGEAPRERGEREREKELIPGGSSDGGFS